MLFPDPRAHRVALVGDAIVNERAAGYDALAVLEAASFGVIVLPPDDFALERIATTMEYVVDDLLEYATHGYRVVVVGSSRLPDFGVRRSYLDAELARRDAGATAVFDEFDVFDVFDVVGTVQADLSAFLADSTG